MNRFTKDIMESLLNENTEGITVMLPGGFKPPHEGHLMLAKGYEKLPQVQKVVILIGPKDREGITAQDSEVIWKALLGATPNIEVRVSKYPSPLLTAYKFIEDDSTEGDIIALGSSSKGSDYDRIRSFVDQHQEGGKYYKKGVSVVELPLEQSKPLVYKGRTDDQNGKPISASQLRADLRAKDFENFKTNYPSIKSNRIIQTVYDKLVKSINLNENGADLLRSTLHEDATLLLRKQFEGLKNKFGAFIDKLRQENRETKEAFQKLVNAVKTGERLEKSEKKEIGDQMKDVLKLAGFTAASIMPGGVIYLLLSKVPALKKHMTPSAFLNENRIPLNEGGAAGHMAHPYEDMDMTFDDIEDMIDAALSGKVEYAQEKLDGQNLMMTYKDGKPLAARKKSQFANAASTAYTQTQFKERNSSYPENIQLIFNESFTDMGKAMEKLSPTEKEEFFGNGTKFVNFEILHPASANAVAYGISELRIHNVTEYDENGNKKKEDIDAAQKLSQALKQVEAQSQNTFDIKSTDLLSLKQTKDYEKQKKELITNLKKVKGKYGLRKEDKLGLYFQNFWSDFIKNNAKTYKYDIPDNVLQNLINRWSFGVKTPAIPKLKKDIDNPEFNNWVTSFDKNQVAVKDQKKLAVEPVSDIFLKLGVYVLENMEGLIAINPNDIVASTKKELRSAIEQIKLQVSNNELQDDDAPLRFLKSELKRIEKAGGYDMIVPTEGVVFKHKGKIYKLTGTFAPVNQIIGYIKFGR